MRNSEFRKLIDRIESMPPTSGHRITREQFYVLADMASGLIHKYGWNKYKSYVDMWAMKIEGYPFGCDI